MNEHNKNEAYRGAKFHSALKNGVSFQSMMTKKVLGSVLSSALLGFALLGTVPTITSAAVPAPVPPVPANIAYNRQTPKASPASPGGTMFVSFINSSSVAICGVGFSWTTASRQRLYVTARHCVPTKSPTAKIYHAQETKTAMYVGTQIGTYVNPAPFVRLAVDTAVMTKNTVGEAPYLNYEGRVYSGSTVASKTAIPIKGTYTPVKGGKICVAGDRYGTVCNYTITQPVSVLKTDGGTFKNTWEARRPGKCINAPGDSGSAVYQPKGTATNGSYAMIAGTLTAGNPTPEACYVYFTDLQGLKKIYGGSVTTS